MRDELLAVTTLLQGYAADLARAGKSAAAVTAALGGCLAARRGGGKAQYEAVNAAQAACTEAWDELHADFWQDMDALAAAMNRTQMARYNEKLDEWKRENGR